MGLAFLERPFNLVIKPSNGKPGVSKLTLNSTNCTEYSQPEININESWIVDESSIFDKNFIDYESSTVNSDELNESRSSMSCFCENISEIHLKEKQVMEKKLKS